MAEPPPPDALFASAVRAATRQHEDRQLGLWLSQKCRGAQAAPAAGRQGHEGRRGVLGGPESASVSCYERELASEVAACEEAVAAEVLRLSLLVGREDEESALGVASVRAAKEASRQLDELSDYLTVYGDKMNAMRRDVEEIQRKDGELSRAAASGTALLSYLRRLTAAIDNPSSNDAVETLARVDTASLDERERASLPAVAHAVGEYLLRLGGRDAGCEVLSTSGAYDESAALAGIRPTPSRLRCVVERRRAVERIALEARKRIGAATHEAASAAGRTASKTSVAKLRDVLKQVSDQSAPWHEPSASESAVRLGALFALLEPMRHPMRAAAALHAAALCLSSRDDHRDSVTGAADALGTPVSTTIAMSGAHGGVPAYDPGLARAMQTITASAKLLLAAAAKEHLMRLKPAITVAEMSLAQFKMTERLRNTDGEDDLVEEDGKPSGANARVMSDELAREVVRIFVAGLSDIVVLSAAVCHASLSYFVPTSPFVDSAGAVDAARQDALAGCEEGADEEAREEMVARAQSAAKASAKAHLERHNAARASFSKRALPSILAEARKVLDSMATLVADFDALVAAPALSEIDRWLEAMMIAQEAAETAASTGDGDGNVGAPRTRRRSMSRVASQPSLKTRRLLYSVSLERNQSIHAAQADSVATAAGLTLTQFDATVCGALAEGLLAPARATLLARLEGRIGKLARKTEAEARRLATPDENAKRARARRGALVIPLPRAVHRFRSAAVRVTRLCLPIRAPAVAEDAESLDDGAKHDSLGHGQSSIYGDARAVGAPDVSSDDSTHALFAQLALSALQAARHEAASYPLWTARKPSTFAPPHSAGGFGAFNCIPSAAGDKIDASAVLAWMSNSSGARWTEDVRALGIEGFAGSIEPDGTNGRDEAPLSANASMAVVPSTRQFRCLAASANAVYSCARDLANASAGMQVDNGVGSAPRSPLRPAMVEARVCLETSLDGYALALIAQTPLLPVIALSKRLVAARAAIASLHKATDDASTPESSYDVRFYPHLSPASVRASIAALGGSDGVMAGLQRIAGKCATHLGPSAPGGSRELARAAYRAVCTLILSSAESLERLLEECYVPYDDAVDPVALVPSAQELHLLLSTFSEV